MQRIKACKDQWETKTLEKLQNGAEKGIWEVKGDILFRRNLVYVPKNDDLRNDIMRAHTMIRSSWVTQDSSRQPRWFFGIIGGLACTVTPSDMSRDVTHASERKPEVSDPVVNSYRMLFLKRFGSISPSILLSNCPYLRALTLLWWWLIG